MDTYATNDYSIGFAKQYKELQVIDKGTEEVEETYDLTESTQLKLFISGGDFELSREDCSNCATHGHDTNGSSEITVDGDNARMGGTGIIDLRDIGRSASSVTYQIDCCAVHLEHAGSGPYAFKVRFDADECQNGCYEYVESE